MVIKTKVHEVEMISPKSGVTKMLSFFKRIFNDISSMLGVALCISIIFYAGSTVNKIDTLTTEFKEMKSDFKELIKEIKLNQRTLENKFDKLETNIKQEIRDFKADINARLPQVK